MKRNETTAGQFEWMNMKGIKTVIIVTLLLFSLVLITPKTELNEITDNPQIQCYSTRDSASDGSSWPMFRYDAAHSATTDVKGPVTNSILWTNSTENTIEASPVVAEGKVYIGSWDKNMYCFNSGNGTLVWKYETGNKITSTPVFYEGKIYFNSGETTSHCINADNGTLIWSNHTGRSGAQRSYSSPLVIDGRFYTSTFPSELMYCRYANNGTLIWESKVGAACSSVVAGNGLIYVGGATESNLTAVYANNGTIKWKYRTENQVHSSPTVVNDRLYVGSQDKYLHCINAITGDNIWKFLTKGNIESSPAYAEGMVYFGSNDDKMYCVDSTGNLTWSYPTGYDIYSSPAIADGKVYFGSMDKKVYCLDASNGSLVWSYKTEAAIFSSPAVIDDTLYIASNNGKIYCFGGDDSTPPTVEITQPMNKTTDVSVTSEISITFSELMSKTTVENALSIMPDVEYGYSWEARTLILTPDSDLEYLTQYNITIGTGAQDTAGISMEHEYEFRFTTEEEPDTDPPNVESTFPANNSVNISVSTTISITFSEPMNETSVENAISIQPSQSYDYSWESRTITIIISFSLYYSTQYNATIDTTAKDVAGNTISRIFLFTFTTEEIGDITPPEILSTSPDIGEKGIRINSHISIQFSEQMNHATVEEAINIIPSIQYTYSWVGNIITIIPDVDFHYLTNYSVVVGAEASDKADNSMLVGYQFYFITEEQDTTPPFVTFSYPENMSANILVSCTIALTFSESMNSTSVDDAISIEPAVDYENIWNGNTDVLQLTPSQNLGYDIIYFVNISSGARDLAGNRMISPVSFSFTTEEEPDTTPPRIKNSEPSNEEIDVDLEARISFTFSEAMKHLSVESALTISPSIQHKLSWNGNVITIIPGNTLDHNTTYTISIGTGARDLHGNQIVEAYSLSFTTLADTIPPTIVITNPSHGETDVIIDTTISLMFSESMDISSVEDAVATSPSIDYSLSWEGSTLSISPETDLDYSTSYTITIATGAVDEAGNGLAEEVELQFVTQRIPDLTPPIIEHVPVGETDDGKDVEIKAIITDNIAVEKALLFYRKTGSTDFTESTMISTGDEYHAIIPASEVTDADMEYYIWATDGINNSTHPGNDSTTNSHEIKVFEEENTGMLHFILLTALSILFILLFSINLWYGAIERRNEEKDGSPDKAEEDLIVGEQSR